MSQLTVETLDRIQSLDSSVWNRLAGTRYPFLRHEFLAALESQGCLGEAYGWLPRHLLLRDARGGVLAKYNSYGELVFDWSWANAYQRAGKAYYPKLVVASPYTPATGPRILTADDVNRPRYAAALAQGAIQVAERMRVSSLHWLFVTDAQSRLLDSMGMPRRIGCQFHWRNPGYRDFDDFLAQLTSRKRKQINRERRRVQDAGIRFRLLRGDEATDEDWSVFHQLYRSTFDKRGGIPTLSLDFFHEIAATMGDQMLLVLSLAEQRVVAAAFNLVGEDTLYGRHWGCFEEYHSLHFEACYYQGLEFCIREGLARFEPGAQGEHKISRGFLPTPTWSNHWIADPGFQTAIGNFLHQETEGMHDYLEEMRDHSPYRIAGPE